MNFKTMAGQSGEAFIHSDNRLQRLDPIFAFFPLIIIVVQILFLIYTNFFCIPETMDNDAAKLFIHAMEIWNKKTVFIPSWSNQSTLEIDCPLFLAVPIYGICRNIYISFGISNLILAAFTVLISFRLLKRQNLSITVILVVLSLILLPYSFGQLLYYNMTFFAGGQYSVKILAPLLLIYVLSSEVSSGRKMKIDPLAIVALFFGLICSVSGGSYIFLTGFLPVIICYVWLILLNKGSVKECLADRGLWTCFAITLISFAGIVISRIKHVNPSTVDASLVEIDRSVPSFLDSFRGYFELFGAFPYDSVSVMSLAGMLNIFKAFFAIVVLLVIMMSIKKSAYDYLVSDKDSFIFTSFVSVILFNFIIIWFTGRSQESRYYVSSLVMGFLLTGSALESFIKRKGPLLSIAQLSAIKVLVLSGIFAVAVLSDIDVIKGKCYPEKLSDNNKLKTLITYIDKNQEKTVIFLDDTDAAEMLRTMDYDSGRLYLAYKTENDTYNNKGLVVNDYYMDLTDASRLDDKHLLIVNSDYTDIERLPIYLGNLYSEVDEFQNFMIYRADTNRMDGISGIAYNVHSRDYCYSNDYTVYGGEITEDGSLMAVGKDDYIVSSYYFGVYSGDLDVIMHYSGECSSDASFDKLGVMELWDTDAHNVIASVDIVPNMTDGEAKLQGVVLDNQNAVLKVFLCEGCSINIDYIDYFRSKQSF